jgi:putative radical SAM enzyme (TIGR03279 family)
MRAPLYVKDDDYRYSFLFGSFITLTNLTEDDWARILEQRLSPLFVSVHASDLEVRRRILNNKSAPDILAQLRRLGSARIRVNAQVVLCPGINDDEILERTITDLAEQHNCVNSVAVVPVGLTRFGPPDGPRRPTVEEMGATLGQVQRWQRVMRRTLGRTFVYLGDEFYLRTGVKPPGARSYDGYPQYQNGVGLARVLLDEWTQARRHLKQATATPHLSLVSGELAAPLLQMVAAELNSLAGANAHLQVVRNNFFGPEVNVAGLLTAGDVLAQLRVRQLSEVVVLPRAMFDSTGIRTLDGYTRDDVERELGLPVEIAGSVGELVALATRPTGRGDFGSQSRKVMRAESRGER